MFADPVKTDVCGFKMFVDAVVMHMLLAGVDFLQGKIFEKRKKELPLENYPLYGMSPRLEVKGLHST